MNYRAAVRLLLDHGFVLLRQEGSHRQYEGMIGGRRRIVTIAYHQASDDVRARTLASIVRQSGLPKRLFR
jgi:predicted RNA binding protein YcfA (HicA-like mRNA interferase family)